MSKKPKSDSDFIYRCTFCQKTVPWPVPAEALGLSRGQEPEPGKMYRYDKCYCGFGRFVICERVSIEPEELDEFISHHMEH